MPARGAIDAVWHGRPYPRGATWDGMGVNFALFSESAERVELCLFDPSGRHELQRIVLREQTDQVWHGYLPQARPGLLYGYRIHGPYRPKQGQRFNGHKLLLDPNARNIVGSLVEVGRGDRPENWIADLLAGRDRTVAGPTAPAEGLVFLGPSYPAEWGLPTEVTL